MFQAHAKEFTHRYVSECYVMITWHHLNQFGTCVWVCNVGRMTGRCQAFCPVPTIFESPGPVKQCCRLQTVIVKHVNVCWSCTFCTQKLYDAALRVLALTHDRPPQRNLQLCRDNTEQLAHDRSLSRLVATAVGRHKND